MVHVHQSTSKRVPSNAELDPVAESAHPSDVFARLLFLPKSTRLTHLDPLICIPHIPHVTAKYLKPSGFHLVRILIVLIEVCSY